MNDEQGRREAFAISWSEPDLDHAQPAWNGPAPDAQPEPPAPATSEPSARPGSMSQAWASWASAPPVEHPEAAASTHPEQSGVVNPTQPLPAQEAPAQEASAQEAPAPVSPALDVAAAAPAPGSDEAGQQAELAQEQEPDVPVHEEPAQEHPASIENAATEHPASAENPVPAPQAVVEQDNARSEPVVEQEDGHEEHPSSPVHDEPQGSQPSQAPASTGEQGQFVEEPTPMPGEARTGSSPVSAEAPPAAPVAAPEEDHGYDQSFMETPAVEHAAPQQAVAGNSPHPGEQPASVPATAPASDAAPVAPEQSAGSAAPESPSRAAVAPQQPDASAPQEQVYGSTPPQVVGQNDEIPEDALTIGRSRSNVIVLDDMLVSRQHVVITADEEGLLMRDLGSRNGTYVNGDRVEQRHLNEGDRISIGASTFEVRDGWLVSV